MLLMDMDLLFDVAIITNQESMQHVCKIPHDLVVEILIRLPAKSLMRFKCVSKKWSSFISSPYFRNRFLTVKQKQPPRLYFFLTKKENFDKANQRVQLLSGSLDNICFVVDQDLTLPEMGGFLYFNGARGLTCFPVREKTYVYNPTTRQLLTLPNIPEHTGYPTTYYIGHDPVNDQYKVVCTRRSSWSTTFDNMKSEHWVLLLEVGGGSWKKVVPLEGYHPHYPNFRRRSINGSVVHYMALIETLNCVFVSFDIRSEELTTIPLPLEAKGFCQFGKLDLIEYGGKIAIFDRAQLQENGLVNLWVLEDAGKKEWSKKTQVLPPCQRHLVCDNSFVVHGTTKDGKVILAPRMMCSPFHFLLYDMQLNDLRKVEIKGLPKLWSDKECNVDFRLTHESDESSFCFKSLNCQS